MAFKSNLIDSVANLIAILFSGILSVSMVFAGLVGGLFPAFTWLQKGVFPKTELAASTLPAPN